MTMVLETLRVFETRTSEVLISYLQFLRRAGRCEGPLEGFQFRKDVRSRSYEYLDTSCVVPSGERTCKSSSVPFWYY